MTTMIFDLPRDLVEEIPSRVPLKSKKAVRLTCKKWNTYLTKMYQRKIAAEAKEGESRIIVSMNNDLYLTSVVVNGNPSIKLLGKLTCLNEQVKISQVFHCKGLLLCVLEGDDTKVVVWNPYSGQTRWIETRYPKRGQYRWFMDRYRYALGYVENKRNKILRFLDYYYRSERYSMYEIYDFDSDDLWKVLDDPSHFWMFPDDQQFGISLKGNTYWCASSTPETPKENDRIICFDFTRERFGPLLLLPFKPDDNSVTLSCVREEKLAVLVEHWKRNTYEIDIWITTKIEVEEVLWSKFLTVDTGPRDCRMSLRNVFIDEEKNVVMGFDHGLGTSNHHRLRIIGEAGYLRKLDLGECEDKVCWKKYVVCFYVPCLVQIKQHARRGGKREKQRNLEKSRYGEKKLKSVLCRI